MKNIVICLNEVNIFLHVVEQNLVSPILITPF